MTHALSRTSNKPALIAVADSPSLDAFGRLRISNPVTLFDSQSEYDTGALLWENSVTGSATITHSASDAGVKLNVTGASGDRAIRQSRQYIRYQPGKSQLALMTFTLAAGQANMAQRVGLFDADNGIFLQEINGAVSVVRRTNTSGSPVDNAVAKASWNIDPMDGTGPSGIIMDFTKAQIFWADLEWLGVGRVRVGFVIAGIFWPVHEFLNSNVLTTVYMRTANLPVRYEVHNTGATGGAKSLLSICSVVMSEGGFEFDRGIPFSANSSSTVNSVTTREPILSIRPKATFNSIVNRGSVIPQSIQAYADTTGALFEVIYGGTLTGASFASVNANSIAEQDTAASSISGGITVASFYVGASAQADGATLKELFSRLPLTLDIAGANPINLSVCATRIGGTGTCNTAAVINWSEFR